MKRLDPYFQFELEKLQVYDIINNSQLGAAHWMRFCKVLYKKLFDAHVKELLKITKEIIRP